MKNIFLIISLAFTQLLTAQLRLPSFISDNMVLQQKKVNRIWGWSKPQQLISVDFNDKKYPAYANNKGEWEVFLEPANAGNAGALIVSADTEHIVVKNILVGELWVCSGQSNMEWTMGMSPVTYKDELKTASNDNIRFVVINDTYANTPQQDVSLEKTWSQVSPSTIANCSAVAYWYAKKLYQNLQFPSD